MLEKISILFLSFHIFFSKVGNLKTFVKKTNFYKKRDLELKSYEVFNYRTQLRQLKNFLYFKEFLVIFW